MKLFIKQKVFSLKDKFSVTDELGNPVYNVEGEFWTIGKKFHVYDTAGNEVLFLKQKLWTLFPRFYVYQGEKYLFEIHQLFSWFKPKYEIVGLDWKIEGSFWEHDYNIIDAKGFSVVSVHKKWMSWGDSYELDLSDSADTLTALGAVLAIDAVLASQAAAASSASVSSGS
ncbi:MAG: LURP-one-related family protein [Oscillospiraceae bacterium]|nr:LURP-one-related family protein [Oscillospiraceae bacterium]